MDVVLHLAARAYGMSPFTMYRRVILPSALRRALPLYSNEVILMLHATTVAFTATVPDILKVARDANSATYMAFQSVESVSGQKPCFVARSTMSQLKWPLTPLPKSNKTPRRRAAATSEMRRPCSSRMLLGGGAYGTLRETGTWIVAVLAVIAIAIVAQYRRRRHIRFGFPVRPVWAEADPSLGT